MKGEVFRAKVTRVLGPDLFEAEVDLGFDVTTSKRLKLASVDWDHLRSLGLNGQQKASEFLRQRVEGQEVVLRVVRRGEYFFAHVLYGPEERDLLDEMVGLGLLKKFERNGDQ